MVLALQAKSTDLLGGTVSSSTDRLYQQMQARVAADVQAKTDKIDSALEQKYDSIGLKEDQLVKVKSSILNAQSAYENAISSLDDVDSELMSLRSVIADAPDGYKNAAETYNTALMSINFAVETYGTSLNPIGNVGPDWEPNTLTYSTDTIVGTRSMKGTYAGTDFKVTTADGTVWRPEDGTTVMQKINPDGTVDDDLYVSMTNGVKLTSYDDETGAITMSITYSAEDPPVEVSGTLERGGLGLMPAWFYRSQDSIDADLPAFSTEADWAAVREDIETAVRRADVARAMTEGGRAQTTSDMGKIDLQMDGLTKEKSGALEESLNDRLDLQTQMQSQYQVMLLNLSRASTVQQQYANIFAGVASRSPFFSVTS